LFQRDQPLWPPEDTVQPGALDLHALFIPEGIEGSVEDGCGGAIGWGHDAVVHPFSLAPRRNNARIAQVRQMTRYLGLRRTEYLNQVTDADLAIAHQVQFPAVTISFNLGQGVALGQATDAVQRAMATMGAPATLSSSFQGTAQAFQQSLSTVPLLILAALVVVYLILGILYESYIHPLTILSTLPSAGVGALAMLMAFGFDFSLIALVGMILLIGIVKKNGIMMVDFAIAAERDEHLSTREAIRKAALLRFRPIMMTTMAALLGGVPLMLGTGTGSEIRQPLGYAMVGGLLVSQALTLFTTPVVYLYLDNLSNALQRWTAPRKQPTEFGDKLKDAAE